jgi:hypothetical protein
VPRGATGFVVIKTACPTCIYRKDSTLDLQKLEADVADPVMAGFFSGYRVCHHTPPGADACCRGFWNRHKHHFTLGQLAQRLKLVRFVPASADTYLPPEPDEESEEEPL